MGIIKKSIIVIVLAVVLRHMYRVTTKLGFHKTIYSHNPGPCHIVPGIEFGSEDIHTFSNGLAIITSGMNLNADPRRVGTLYLFDFKDPDEGVTRLDHGDLELINPHGVGAWVDPDGGEVTVFLIHHPPEGDAAEKFHFDLNTKTLTHLESITDDKFINLNAILPVSSESFYTTNTMASGDPIDQMIEMFLLLHRGTLVFYNGLQGHIIADNFGVTNGIAMSPDGKFLYVASTLDEAIDIFHRMPDNNLVWKGARVLHTHVDNIKVDNTTGDLYIGSSPRLYQWLLHSRNPDTPAPAQVLRVKVDKDGDVEHVEEIFAEDGDNIYQAATGAYYNGSLLIGTVLHKLMYCKVNYLADVDII